MAVVHPFRALRPPAELVAQVASVPYDVVNTEEARALAAGNPWSFLHVSRPEIDLPPGADAYSDDAYKKASDNFRELIDRCPLKMDAGAWHLHLSPDHGRTRAGRCCRMLRR